MNSRPWSGKHCARCTYPMAYIQAEPLWVEHCYRCGGSFVQRGQASHAIGEFADPSQWKVESFVRPPIPSPLSCPGGHGRLVSYLLRHEKEEVEIDGCQHCGGMWLDDREARALAAITSQHHHEKARPGSGLGIAGVAGMYLFQLATLLPARVKTPLRQRPIVTRSLVVLLLVLWGLQALVEVSGLPRLHNLGALMSKSVGVWTAYQLVSHAFLHGGFMHVAGNVYMLWVFGENVEDALGRGRFMILYAVSAIGGGAFFLVTHWNQASALVGASGAISGLMGAFLVLFPKTKLWFNLIIQFKLRAYWYMAFYILLNIAIIGSDSNVSWEAHLGGFAAGAAVAFAFRRDTDDAMPATVRLPRG